MERSIPATSGSSTASVVLDHPAERVWAVVRDFDSYPVWVDGVDDSYVEDGLPGTTVGCVRNFSMGGSRTRQRLLAHSDVDRFFTYGSCAPLMIGADGTTWTMHGYEGTLRLDAVTDGDRCLAVWSATYRCPADQAEFWAAWWREAIPTWLGSLRHHVDGGQRIPCGSGRWATARSSATG